VIDVQVSVVGGRNGLGRLLMWLGKDRGIILKHFSGQGVAWWWDVVEAHHRGNSPAAARFLDTLLDRLPLPVSGPGIFDPLLTCHSPSTRLGCSTALGVAGEETYFS